MQILSYNVHIPNPRQLKQQLEALAPGQIRLIVGPMRVLVRAQDSVNSSSITSIVDNNASH